MDQVIILLNRYFANIKDENGESAEVTKNMINNYVKMKIVPAPIKKKYSRTHIAYLIIVCTMKQIFSISMIKRLLPDFEDEGKIEEIYIKFIDYFQEAISEDVKKYSMEKWTDHKEAAIRMSSEAIVLTLLAEHMLYEPEA
ncbi:hypothetical protein IMSAG049_01049 [Clostridiales bacterium]|nr:hypothetical protein IMSAG049_01049 [Clostridiales bacterium]